jgi:hypothetical protein
MKDDSSYTPEHLDKLYKLAHEIDLELPQDYNSIIRPSFEETFMRSALLWSRRSTCPRAKVGCVLASADNYTLATGYNGAPTGAKHCLEIPGREAGDIPQWLLGLPHPQTLPDLCQGADPGRMQADTLVGGISRKYG